MSGEPRASHIVGGEALHPGDAPQPGNVIVARAPGKLYIAGEYAVVEPGEPAILIAVDRYLTVTLRASSEAGRIHSSAYGEQPIIWRRDDDESIVVEHSSTDYVVSAISVLERLRAERGLAPRYFDLSIESDLIDESGRKLGLGSSGAVTVAVVSAVNDFYGLRLSRFDIYRVALLATILISPKASGGDLAAISHGGWIRYSAPDRFALRQMLEQRSVTDTLENGPWDGLVIEPIEAPTDLDVIIGWTGSPASTERLVDEVRRPGRDEDRDAQYARFVAQSRELVEELHEQLLERPSDARASIRQARALLQNLGAVVGQRIETEALAILADIAEDHGAAGKSSGAGGGDCGIVLAPASADTAAIRTAWQAAGITPLNFAVAPAFETRGGRGDAISSATRKVEHAR